MNIAIEFALSVSAKENTRHTILAIYQTAEELLQRLLRQFGIPIGCTRGCASCCFQQVSCSKWEFRQVLAYIHQLPAEQKKALLLQLQKSAQEWRRYAGNKKYLLDVFTKEGARDNQRAYKDWLGKPCVFLEEKSQACLIYPVRFLECRLTIGGRDCAANSHGCVALRPENIPNGNIFALEYVELRQLATRILNTQNARKTGAKHIRPLPAWLTDDKLVQIPSREGKIRKRRRK